jgi:predicted ATPase
MRISSVQLSNFKRFTNLMVEGIPPAAKLVILVGPNGCGKSSLFEGMNHYYRQESGHGISHEFDYALKEVKTDNPQWNAICKVKFHDHPTIRGKKQAMRFRTAYRNSSDFQITSLNRLPAPSENLTFRRLIENDSSVEQNYQRLIAATINGVYSCAKDDLSVPALREELVGKLQKSLRNVFDDLELRNLVDPFSDGTFFFKKGTVERYAYKNLSGGEKAAFDLLLDFHVTLDHFTDSVFCIDEPETHMHTALQAKLLEEIYNIVPAPSQIWISTHSLGAIRLAHRLEKANPGSVAVLDFTGHNFDQPVVITPSNSGKILCEKVLSIALEGHADDLMPDRVVICEGSFEGNRRKNFDAEVYSKIFAGDSITFISGGSCNDLLKSDNLAAAIVTTLFPAKVSFRLLDRDERSPEEVRDLATKGEIRILPRRNLECYLLDDEVLTAWIKGKGMEDRAGEVISTKQVLLKNASEDPERRRAPDDCKSISGELLTFLTQELRIPQLGSNSDAFMLHQLAPQLRPGFSAYDELRAVIFN